MKTHKIIYNSEYGGFNFSEIAISWLKKHIEDNSIDISKDKNFSNYIAASIENKNYWFKEIILNLYPRHHEIYQKMVESVGHGDIDYGLKLCGGDCSSLKFWEIEENAYYIEEYDGLESIVTIKDFIKIES